MLTVKQLIEKLQKHDPSLPVVVDTLEGAYGIYEYVSAGSVDQKHVVWITLDTLFRQKAKTMKL